MWRRGFTIFDYHPSSDYIDDAYVKLRSDRPQVPVKYPGWLF
jgi:hypothetical protein